MPDDIFHKDIGAIKQYAISGSPVALPSTQTRESHEKVREDLTKLLHEQFGVTVVCLSHYTYILLTKRKVKMAGYWPSSLFAFLWTETKSRSIKT